MSLNSPPPPDYPSDEITMRTYVERMIADLSASVKQKWDDVSTQTRQQWRDAIELAQQRWEDHTAVHARDAVALTRALEQATTALAAALEAHRREHAIAENAQTKADATHQTQHEALNELRDVVGDLTGQYVPLSSLATITESWERRWAERQKEFESYRESLAKEVAAFRESHAREQAAYRDTIRMEIAALRESKYELAGRQVGGQQSQAERHASATDTRGMLALAISGGLLLLGLLGFIIAQMRMP